MKIELQLFGAFRHYGERLTISLPSSGNIKDLRSVLMKTLQGDPGKLSKEALIQSSRFATEDTLLAENTPLKTGMMLAILPPVSGG